MKIKQHRLFNDDDTPVRFAATPNMGGALRPEYLVMHFTAGRDMQSAVEWFQSPQAKASAHLVIGRNEGEITQLVPFNRVAWHAGVSRWAGHEGMNQFSIGIELVNAGKLHREGDKWRAWYGGEIPNNEVIEATHKAEHQPAGWQTYTETQIQKAVEVANVLVRQYGLKDVLGHEDIAPGRKVDPGPAFPMGSFRAKVMGREENEPHLYRTTATLNIRSGPGTEFKAIPGSPLAPNTPVRVLEEAPPWVRVDVQKPSRNVADVVGWVHMRFLKVD